MATARILAFAGSTRKDSYNKRLMRIGAAAAAAAGAEVTQIDLKDYPLPLYDGDLEAEHGIPANAMALKKLFLEHDGLLIASPEYNSSITPLLKNTIDWVSRRAEGEGPLAAYKNKTAALISASPGALGGLRALVHVRAILGNIGVLVLPAQFAVNKANEAFDSDGKLKDPKLQSSIEELAKSLAETIVKLKS